MEGLSTTTEKTEPRNKFYTTILLVALCFNTGCDYFNEEPQDTSIFKPGTFSQATIQSSEAFKLFAK